MAGGLQPWELPRFGWQRTALASAPETQPVTLARLARSSANVSARKRVASNPNTPEGLLASLARDSAPQVREVVANNARTPAWAVRLLEDDPVTAVRFAAWANPRADEVRSQLVAPGPVKPGTIPKSLPEAYEALRRGQIDALVGVNGWFASSSTSIDFSADVLRLLAHAPRPQVRLAVTHASQLDNAILKLLAYDEDEAVRAAVADTSRDSAVLWQLLDQVRGLTRNGETVYRHGQWWPKDVAESLARNHNSPADLLDALSLHQGAHVRGSIASHKNTSIRTLESLSDDKFLFVLWKVADNANASATALSKVFRRRPPLDPFLRNLDSVLASAPASPSEGSWLTAGQDVNGLRSSWREVLHAVAAHANTPSQVLESLANEGYKEEVAGNRKTPAHLLRKIARDAHTKAGYDSNDNWVDETSLLTALARNPNLPTESLLELLSDVRQGGGYTVGAVELAAAENPNAPADLLLELSRRKSWDSDLRRALGENPATPAEALVFLGIDYDEWASSVEWRKRRLREEGSY